MRLNLEAAVGTVRQQRTIDNAGGGLETGTGGGVRTQALLGAEGIYTDSGRGRPLVARAGADGTKAEKGREGASQALSRPGFSVGLEGKVGRVC